MSGNRIISLQLLGNYIQELTSHAAICGYPIEFLGETRRTGLSSVLTSRCTNCLNIQKMHTSEMVKLKGKNHYSSNLGAVLGQVATGGGSAHLEEQLMSMDIPSLSQYSFVNLERSLGLAFETLVTNLLLSTGKEEKEHAIANGTTFEGIPACIVVDAGWSKRSHKHSYNANSGVGVIFGAHTKKLLFIGIRNKYCSTCSIAKHKNIPVPSHKCFRNWTGSSCAMESDIIVEGFKRSESMHGLRYMWMIGDGDSSVYLSVTMGVPYGRHIQKVECSNHAVKCYRGGLEKLAKDNASFRGRSALTSSKIRQLAKGMKCAMAQHSTTKDVSALRHDLRNCPRHCFGDHQHCSNSFCKHAGEGHGGK